MEKVIWASAITILILIWSALLAPWLALFPSERIDLQNRLLYPCREHLLGTDELGRDILSRLLYGGRVSFLISISVVSLSLGIGATLGAVSGLAGRWADELVMRLADLLLAFPGILLTIGLVAVLEPSIQNVILALILVGWVSYARLTRSLILKFKELDFVNASRSLGASAGRILYKHIMPNVLPSLMVQTSFSFAGMILAESSLSFLGLGVQPPEASWGSMLNEGKNHLLDAPHLMVFPGLAIFVSVLSFNLLGDALRDRLDPRFLSEHDKKKSRQPLGGMRFDT